MSAGCSAQITPPAIPELPRAVFVLDHGMHTSLVVADEHGDLVRYSYGDWRYYAEGKTGVLSTLRALIIPSKAALGRRELSGPATESNVEQQVRVDIRNMLLLQAEARFVDRLRQRLDGIYRQAGSPGYRPEYDLEFVPYPRSYTMKHNSNRVIADWLTELGSQIHGSPLLSDWRIKPDAP